MKKKKRERILSTLFILSPKAIFLYSSGENHSQPLQKEMMVISP